MPYITQNKRDQLDPLIASLHKELVNIQTDDESNNMEGNINYVITKLLDTIYDSPSYRELNDAIGVLECCKLEYYRKVAVPYEQNKEYENGEVYTTEIQRQCNRVAQLDNE